MIDIETMNLQKQVYGADDIQKLFSIGRSKAYAFWMKHMRGIKIGKLHRVLKEGFGKWTIWQTVSDIVPRTRWM